MISQLERTEAGKVVVVKGWVWDSSDTAPKHNTTMGGTSATSAWRPGLCGTGAGHCGKQSRRMTGMPFPLITSRVKRKLCPAPDVFGNYWKLRKTQGEGTVCNPSPCEPSLPSIRKATCAFPCRNVCQEQHSNIQFPIAV